jgi:SpoVK/Ycf46/Vps4 family AAA+-type ATPase
MEHLLAQFGRLELLLRREVMRLRAANLLTQDEFRGLYIPDPVVDALLHRAGRTPSGLPHEAAEAYSIQELTSSITTMEETDRWRLDAMREHGTDLPLVRLGELFDLTAFELDVLLVCAAPGIDLGYETVYSYIQNDVTKKQPTVDLVLRVLCAGYEEQFDRRATFHPSGALFRNHLLQVLEDPHQPNPSFLARQLKTSDRVVAFLLSRDTIDDALYPFTRCVRPSFCISELALPEAMKEQLAYAAHSFARNGGVFRFTGPGGSGKRAAAEAVCATLGIGLVAADLSAVDVSVRPLHQVLALLRREAMLRGAGLYVGLGSSESLANWCEHRTRPPGLSELSLPGLPTFIGTEAPVRLEEIWPGEAILDFDLPLPSYPLRLQLWRKALNGSGRDQANALDVSAVSDKFALSPGQIEAAARKAHLLTELRPPELQQITLDDLHQAARSSSHQGLQRLAQQVPVKHSWQDIVLPTRAMQGLREVCASVKYRHVVYSAWGFDGKLALGKGLNVLFMGSSGTGKTMAAQVVAGDLGLDLFKIDLSSVVSKYIGETEKNLNSIFREARTSNAILFFDEADALFGKRSEIKDAHDRYANIEVAYLLQKMEESEGIVILATNLTKNIDDAFARRMHHTIEFPSPDAAQRERIWRGIFPAEAPVASDVDYGFLARQFELSGGNIRNVALAAAFLASEEGSSIGMAHLVRSVARELQKIGKLPSKADFREYYELIRARLQSAD